MGGCLSPAVASLSLVGLYHLNTQSHDGTRTDAPAHTLTPQTLVLSSQSHGRTHTSARPCSCSCCVGLTSSHSQILYPGAGASPAQTLTPCTPVLEPHQFKLAHVVVQPEQQLVHLLVLDDGDGALVVIWEQLLEGGRHNTVPLVLLTGTAAAVPASSSSSAAAAEAHKHTNTVVQSGEAR